MENKAQAKVTINHIADAAQVSRKTATYIISGKGWRLRVPSEVEEKVLYMVREFGFKPSTPIKTTKGTHTPKITLIDTQGNLSVNLGTIECIQEQLRQREVCFSIETIGPNEIDDDYYFPIELSEWSADGIILNDTPPLPDRIFDFIKNRNIPCVRMNHQDTHNTVYSKEKEAAEELTSRISEKGHENIAYLEFANYRHRRMGYGNTMLEMGLEPLVYSLPAEENENQSPYVYKLFNEEFQERNITALITAGQQETNTALSMALRMGISVPETLSIVGFFQENSELYKTWNCSGMKSPDRQLGRAAVYMLLQLIEWSGKEVPSLILPWQWQDGHTLK